MRPYLLVLCNQIRLTNKKFRSGFLQFSRVEMFGWNTKMRFASGSTVILGDRIVSDGRLTMLVDRDARLEIKSQVYFNENTMISCKRRITIGEGCKFGPNVVIIDNNHKFNMQNGVSDLYSAEEIEIGAHSWIGANTVILKGAKIGRNCVIGAGCVISCEVPDGTIVTQAREIRMEPMRK